MHKYINYISIIIVGANECTLIGFQKNRVKRAYIFPFFFCHLIIHPSQGENVKFP